MRSVVITGTSTGIGWGTAKVLIAAKQDCPGLGMPIAVVHNAPGLYPRAAIEAADIDRLTHERRLGQRAAERKWSGERGRPRRPEVERRGPDYRCSKSNEEGFVHRWPLRRYGESCRILLHGGRKLESSVARISVANRY